LYLRLLYIHRNLTRNLLRTLLTCAAVALPVVIYVLTTSVVHQIDKFLDNSVKQLRLVVTNKTSVVNPLPQRYSSQIQSLDPTRRRLWSVCGVVWIGGQVPDKPLPLSTLAVDHAAFFDTFPEYREALTAEQRAEWMRDRQAIIIGRATAVDLGLSVGDRVTILPTLPPYTPMEFHLVSTAPGVEDELTNFCRRDYLEGERKNARYLTGMITFFFVKCATREDLVWADSAIDELFARSPDQTRTLDEKTFMSELINQQFNLPRNLRILSAVTIFVAVMAAANTMSMNFRDRFNEFATLKAIGFSGWFAWLLILVESLTLCAIGGTIGAMGPYCAFTYTPLGDLTIPVIQHLEIDPKVCLWAVLISLGIGLLAGASPAWQAARMQVVTALRKLE